MLDPCMSNEAAYEPHCAYGTMGVFGVKSLRHDPPRMCGLPRYQGWDRPPRASQIQWEGCLALWGRGGPFIREVWRQ